MRVLQTIQEFGVHKGGISSSTYELISAMHKTGSHVDLLTLDIKDKNDRQTGCGEEWIKVLPNDAKTPYGYSDNIKNFLAQSEYDIYHTNGLWLHCNHATCAAARGKNRPYIITPHGMLYPNALRRSYWKKWPLIQLCFRQDIKAASCIHATCRQEMEHVRGFGYSGPIAVIPNLINLPDYINDIASNKKYSYGTGKPFRFGFLGRLHPIKKIENLLYAISELPKDSSCELIIVGSGDEAYMNFLKTEILRLGLKNVNFKGFLSGREKYEELARLTCLFLPSDSENFGMIVTEALSVKTPVMASLGTPWEDLNAYRCGWWTDRNPDNIADIMQTIMNMSTAELAEMGNNGTRLVNEKYGAEKVACQMKALYEWLYSGGSQPDFVHNK